MEKGKFDFPDTAERVKSIQATCIAEAEVILEKALEDIKNAVGRMVAVGDTLEMVIKAMRGGK